jgi:uracil phosphoribosyltransferase
MVEGVARSSRPRASGTSVLYRDHDTLEPVDYYFKVPGRRGRAGFLSSRPDVGDRRQRRGGRDLAQARRAHPYSLPLLVAAPEGVRRLAAAHPDVSSTAPRSTRAERAGYILPGLGDAGDRLFGTR